MSRYRNFKRFIKTHREIHRMAKTIAILYGVLYYVSAGYIQFSEVTGYKQLFVSNPLNIAVKMRAPFLWEAIAEFQVPPFFIIRLAPVNLLLMLLLIWLVYLNLSLFITSVRFPRVCQLTRNKGRLAALFPALLTGFSCCAPTVIIMFVGVLGAFSSTLVLIFAWLIPISILLLVIGIVQGLTSLHLHY